MDNQEKKLYVAIAKEWSTQKEYGVSVWAEPRYRNKEAFEECVRKGLHFVSVSEAIPTTATEDRPPLELI